MVDKSKRPSPSESATLFKVGTVKRGNDGNMWIVYQTSAGVKRWKKQISSKAKPALYVKVKSNNITEFQLPSIRSFKKIGTLKITSKVVVGDFDYGPKDGFSKFGKGTYHAYTVDDNLVLSKKIINKTQASKIIWKYTNYSVPVDTGTFGFWDLKIVRGLAAANIVQAKESSKGTKRPIRKKFLNYLLTKIPSFYINKDTLVKIKNLDDAEFFEEYGFDGNTVIGFAGTTGTGDGIFGCYSYGDTALLLQGGNTAIKLWDIAEAEEDIPPHLAAIKKYRKRKTKSRK